MTVSILPVDTLKNNGKKINDLKCILDNLSKNQRILLNFICDIDEKICDLGDLLTDEKDCLVDALNELYEIIKRVDLVDNGDGTYTFTDVDGNETIIDTRADSNPVNEIPELPGENVQEVLESISIKIVEIEECLADLKAVELVDNGDGSYTYTNIDGTEVTWSSGGNVETIINQIQESLVFVSSGNFSQSPDIPTGNLINYFVLKVRVPQDGAYIVRARSRIKGQLFSGFIEVHATDTNGFHNGVDITTINPYDPAPWVTTDEVHDGIEAPIRSNGSETYFRTIYLATEGVTLNLLEDQYVYFTVRAKTHSGALFSDDFKITNPQITIARSVQAVA